MVQFCTAYKSVLMKHTLFATATTGRLIVDNTGLPITLLLSHKQGGHQQINARIAYNEIDLVLLFTDPNTTDPWDDSQMIETIRYCDKHKTAAGSRSHSAPCGASPARWPWLAVVGQAPAGYGQLATRLWATS